MNSKGQILLMPGLGLSPEIFNNYNFPGYDIVKLRWIDPLPQESIESYMERLTKDVSFGNNKNVFIGHSFGGVIAQELARKHHTNKIFLISSIKSETEIPLKLNLLKYFRMYKLISKALIGRSFRFWAERYGYDSEERREFFLRTINQHSDTYFKWATRSIIHWKNPSPDLDRIVQFHGDKDKTFPIELIKKPVIIPGGDHLMVMKKRMFLNQAILDNLN